MSTTTMHTTVNLRPYIADSLPTLDGGDKIFLRQQLKNIQDSIGALIVAAQALEARIVAGGL